jgi:phosphopantothenoylcysteine decarboxylase
MYLCFTGRVVIAPAMNVEMWNHPAVKRNLQQLQQDGVDVIDPASGWLSCRVEGKGRMAEPEQIFQQLTGAK